jgi:hypothetical protein
MDTGIEIEKTDKVYGENNASGYGSSMSILHKNRWIIAAVVVMLIIIIVLYMRKDKYINQPIRSDTQSDFSIDTALKKFINHQERLIQQYS